MADKNQSKKDDRWARGGLFIPAGLFLGFGIGFLVDDMAAGMFVGLGIGFFAFGAVAVLIR